MSDPGNDDEAELLDLIRLTMVSGVGPVACQALLDRFGSASRVLRSSVSQLAEVDGIGEKTAARIARGSRNDAETELALCREHDVRLLVRGSNDYPKLLGEMHDPPSYLYTKGTIEPVDQLAIAIVGSRKCTPYGLRIAERLASSLARVGLTVVSGLARGIDSAAHRGALAAGGRTIAVLGNGLSKIYPPEHDGLAREVVESGAIFSEVPMRFKPLPDLFPRRNRIISGLCLGVVVVEATPKSGSLSTARHAMEQNREVFAVPGPVDSLSSRGCHGLIRDGATLVETVDDILEQLGPLVNHARSTPEAPVVSHPVELAMSDRDRALLGLMEHGPLAVDELTARSGLPVSDVMAAMTMLEFRRLVKRLPGPAFGRT